MLNQENPVHVTALGGGTGTYTVLRALTEIPGLDISAVLNTFDDGGSNQVMRDDFGLPPTSGIRQAMVALSSQESLLKELFSYRYHRGQGLSGMTFGNLFLAAASDICGSPRQAIKKTAELLSVQGHILPITYEDARLVATYEDGSEVHGEHAIDEPKHDGKLRITKIRTEPTVSIDAEAMAAIQASDLIVLGPGDLYTNTLTNLIVDGIVEALIDSKAFILFIINLMTKYGDAYNYRASDYVLDLSRFFPLERVNRILINSETVYPEDVLSLYQAEQAIPVLDDLDETSIPNMPPVMRRPIVSDQLVPRQPGDILKRSMIRHDVPALAMVFKEILTELSNQ